MPVTYANLLVVIADAESLAGLSENLRQLALYDVTVTNSLAGAEKLAHEQAFDVVLLDMSLKDQCSNY